MEMDLVNQAGNKLFMQFVRALCGLVIGTFGSHLAHAACSPNAQAVMVVKFTAQQALLGTALSDYTELRPSGTCARHFQGGSIYFDGTAAHEIHGAIRQKWFNLGAENSFLGFPQTDERKSPDEVGRYNHFQGGSIYWRPCVGAFEVHGLIRDLWAQQGWELGSLGYPKSDENIAADGVGRFSEFQGGAVYYHPDWGTFSIQGENYRIWKDKGGVAGLGYPMTQYLCNGLHCQQWFTQRGVLDNLSPDYRAGRDLRPEIARRGMSIENQGPNRGTCSVFTMSFLLAYQYSEMCGNHLANLSEEYLNHTTNLATGRMDDGDFFSNIESGYETYGVVPESMLPYDPNGYTFAGYTIPQSTIDEGASYLSHKLKLQPHWIRQIAPNPGLSGGEFSQILQTLDRGIPVAVGRSHSLPIVGYLYDSTWDGGGYFILRNSYGTGVDESGYRKESFATIMAEAYDVFYYDRTNN